MGSAIALNPFDCRMWDMHDRIDALVNEETCKAEIHSFEKHGQLVPVLGRTLRNDPNYRVELIYGARRLFVARHINMPLLVEIREMSDIEAIVAMDIENRQRSDVSPYERGMSYARWLRAGKFGSQDELARTLRVSPSQVSRLLKLAQLPPAIMGAFENPAEICEGWALNLVEALEDLNRRPTTLRRAREIAGHSPRPPAREVYRQLLSSSIVGRKLRRPAHDEVVKDKHGAPLFRIRHQNNAIALVLPIEKVSPVVLQSIREALAAILQQSAAITLDIQKSPACHPN